MATTIILKQCASGATESTLVVNRSSIHKIQDGEYAADADEAFFQVTIKSREFSWPKVDALVDGLFQANPHIEDGKDFVWQSPTDWCVLRARRGEFRSPSAIKRQLRDAVTRITAKYKLPGTESEWTSLGVFRLEGSQMYLVDPGLSGNDAEGLKLDLPVGNYEVFIRVMTIGWDHRVSRFRAVLQGRTPSLGSEIEKGAVDTGRFAICDHRAFRKARNESEDAALRDFFASMYEQSHGVVQLAGVPVFHAESGFGYGSYPIFGLCENNQRIGAEVEFIRSDDDFPEPVAGQNAGFGVEPHDGSSTPSSGSSVT